MVKPAEDGLYEAMSAVMDGRATSAEWERVNAAWARDAQLRERWALWHATADGLRSAELPTRHADSQGLLDALHGRMPAALAHPSSWRDWLPPLAVAASFVAMALGVGLLRPVPGPDVVVAALPVAAPRAQGLSGLSFAQAAAGLGLPAVSAARESGLPGTVAPDVLDWGLALPEPAASQNRP